MIPFVKMDACGNDYIYVDCRKPGPELQCLLADPVPWAIRWSDRHHGIGADGLVLIEKSAVADARMRMFNADGSEGAMCGNAIRCVGMLIHEDLATPKLRVETKSGIRELWVEEDLVTVDMGAALWQPEEIPVSLPGDCVVAQDIEIQGVGYSITCVSMGNPHCVMLTENVENVDVPGIGIAIEYSTELFPERVNVEFVEIVDSRTLKMQVWERGSGETLACGTGACAAVAAAVRLGYCPEMEEIQVLMKGGRLTVCYTENAVFLKGSAVPVFKGWICDTVCFS